MRENIISSKNNTSKHSAESPRFGNDNTNIISTFDTYEKADVVPVVLEYNHRHEMLNKLYL